MEDKLSANFSIQEVQSLLESLHQEGYWPEINYSDVSRK